MTDIGDRTQMIMLSYYSLFFFLNLRKQNPQIVNLVDPRR